MAAADIDIRYVAHLARLKLSPAEEAEFGAQLGDILAYMAQLQRVDVAGVIPTAHPFPLQNVTRPDAVQPSLPPVEALQNAPASANDLFLVPKIVE